MVIWIALVNDLKVAVPIAIGFVPEKVKVVRQRPPDISICRKPSRHIPDISLIIWRSRIRKARVLIGVEKNQLCLNPKVCAADPRLFDGLKIPLIELRKIPLLWRRTHKRRIPAALNSSVGMTNIRTLLNGDFLSDANVWSSMASVWVAQ